MLSSNSVDASSEDFVDPAALDDLALVRCALDLAGGDDQAYWRVVQASHGRCSRLIFAEAVRLSSGADPAERRVAADVLGRLGVAANSPFADETIPVLARLCTEEEEPEVVASSINALGHLGRPEGLPHVLAKAGHPQASVRLAVAVALPSVVGDRRLEPTDPAMLALTGLTTDVDPNVRNWATFGLGAQLQVDGAVVRECLHARLADSHAETRAEALVGLARRHAPGIVGQVRDALNAAVVGRLAVEAAALLRDPSLGATLARLADWWDVDAELLDEAQRRCAPFAVHEEANLVAALVAAADGAELRVTVSSEWPDSDDGPDVHVGEAVYALGPLLCRADGSIDAAVRMIFEDLANG